MNRERIIFPFEPSILDMFKGESSINLARALKDKYGFHMYCIIYEGLDKPSNYLVLLPDNRYMDINGIWVRDVLISFWRDHPDNLDRRRPLLIKVPVEQKSNAVVQEVSKILYEGYIRSTYVSDVFEIEGNKLITKFISCEKHAFRFQYMDRFLTDEELISRTKRIYKYFSDKKIGPKVYNIIESKSGIHIVMEYIPIENTVDKYEDLIMGRIKFLHECGIYHGDLHGHNLRFREDMSLVLIDLDTVFFREELFDQTSNIYKTIKQWFNVYFNLSIEDGIDDELN